MYFKGSPLLVCSLFLGVLGKPHQPKSAPRRKLSRHAQAAAAQRTGRVAGTMKRPTHTGTCRVGSQSSRRCLQETDAASLENPYEDGPVINGYAGIGVGTYDGDGKGPLLASFKTPTAITEDPIGRIFYISDSGNTRVRGINRTIDKVSTIVKAQGGLLNVTVGGAHELVDVKSLDYAFYYNEHIYLSDYASSRIFRVHKSGSPIELIAGSDALRGASGDCGAATLSRLRYPRGLSVIPSTAELPARLAIADSGNNRIRLMDITGWPGCVEKRYECLGPFIDRTKGTTCDVCEHPDDCEDECNFVTQTADECAFTCGHYNRELYGVFVPKNDVSFNKVNAERMLKVLDDDGLGLTAPFTAINDDGSTGESLQKGSVIKGLINNTRLRVLSYAQLVTLIGRPGPYTMVLRFEKIAVRACTDWLWWRNESDPEALPSGKCFLKAGPPPVKTPITGIRVVRGFDWKWGNQDGGYQGVTVAGEEQVGWVKVRWDNNKEESYRIGAGGMEYQFFDLQQLPDPFCQKPAKMSAIEPGMPRFCCPQACPKCYTCTNADGDYLPPSIMSGDGENIMSVGDFCCREYVQASMNKCNEASAPCMMAYTMKQITGKFCKGDAEMTDKTFTNLDDASNACMADSQCGYVTQKDCIGTFMFCKAEVELLNTTSPGPVHCVWEKRVKQKQSAKCHPVYAFGYILPMTEGYFGGPSTCCPGRVQTMVGKLPPGSINWDEAGEIPLVSHRLKTPLKGPRAVVTNSDVALTLFISDTGGHRIVAYPTNSYTIYRARFWILLTGPNATHMKRIVQDEELGEGIEGSIAKALKRILSPVFVYAPTVWQKTASGDEQNNNETIMTAFDVCDPIDRANNDYLNTLETRVDDFYCSFCSHACPSSKNYEGADGSFFGYKGQGCCETACRQCVARCSIYLIMLEAAKSAQEQCEAIAKLDTCLEGSHFCANITAEDNVPMGCGTKPVADSAYAGADPGHKQNPVMDKAFLAEMKRGVDPAHSERLHKFCPGFNHSYVHTACSSCDNEVYRVVGADLNKLALDEGVLDTGPCGMCQGGCLKPPFDGSKCDYYDDPKTCLELEEVGRGKYCNKDIFGRRLQNAGRTRMLQEDSALPEGCEEDWRPECGTSTTTTTSTTTPMTIGLFYDLSNRGKNAWLRATRQLARLKRDQYQKEKGFPTHKDGENLFEEFMESLRLNMRGIYGKESTNIKVNVTIVSAYGEGNDAFKFFGTSFVQPPSAAYWSFGAGTDGYTKDDETEVPAKTAKFHAPLGLAVDKANQLYVADSMNARIRRIKLEDELVGSVAGEGLQYYQGDGGLGVEGSMNLPSDVVIDGDGVAFFTDTNNHRIRRLDGLYFIPPCPNMNGYLKDIGIPLTRTPLMTKFQKQIITRTKSWGGGADYTAFEYVTNRWVDVEGVPIDEWIAESQDTPPVEKLKKRTKSRIDFLFELAVQTATECGKCNATDNKIVKGCGSATDWALCHEDRIEPYFQDSIFLKPRIAQHAGRVCLGARYINCEIPFCAMTCDQCINPPATPPPSTEDEIEELDDWDNSSNATMDGPTCDVNVPLLMTEAVITSLNRALHFLDLKQNRSRWRCPRIKWNNGTGTRQGVLIQDVMAEVMDETRTPDHMLDDAIKGLQQGVCNSPCGQSICDSKVTDLPGYSKANIASMMAQKTKALDDLKQLRRKSKPKVASAATNGDSANQEVAVTNGDGEADGATAAEEEFPFYDEDEDGVFSVEETTKKTAADEQQFKDLFASTVYTYSYPVPDELSYDSSCRDLFFDWYADVIANCTETGSRFYHRASQIPQRMFNERMAQTGEIGPSPCHPGCGLLNPDLADGNEDCCGADGYLCQENEGNCDVDSDCDEGLICGERNCIWNGLLGSDEEPDNCCTKPRWKDQLMEMRDLSLQIGLEQVNILAAEIENAVSERGEKVFYSTWCGGCGSGSITAEEACTGGRRLFSGDREVLVPRWTKAGVTFNRTHNIVIFRNRSNTTSIFRFNRSNHSNSNSSNSTIDRTRSRSKKRKGFHTEKRIFSAISGESGFRRLMER